MSDDNAPGALEHPAAGGSYLREPDGALKLVERTENDAPASPDED